MNFMSDKKTTNQSTKQVPKPNFNTSASSDFDKAREALEQQLDAQKERTLEQVKREEAKRKAETERAKRGTSKKSFGLPFNKKGMSVASDEIAENKSGVECEVDFGEAPSDDILSDIIGAPETPDALLKDEFPKDVPGEDDFVGTEISEELLSNASYEEYTFEQNQANDMPELSNVVSIVEQEPVNIPDDIMKDITTKEVLRKWIENILQDVRYSLTEYYAKHSDVVEELSRRIRPYDYNTFRKKVVEIEFEDIRCRIKCITPLLTDLLHDDIWTITDICIAVYGMMSDEVYLIRHFMKLYNDKQYWSEFFMWNDCKNNDRLARILNLR